jgi:hypothetical protein
VVGQSVEVRGGYCFSMALDVLECPRRLASNGEVTSTVALSGVSIGDKTAIHREDRICTQS